MNNTETSISIPLTSVAHKYAQKFQAEQATSEKAKKVYFNTLAVYAVHSFLQLVDIATDISKGDSWHPITRKFHDVADLVLPYFGILECRPILAGEKFIILPREVTEDRIGTVTVLFEESLEQAHILGFTPTNSAGLLPEVIQISQLQAPEKLLEQLEQLEKVGEPKQRTSENLSKWLENIIGNSWQTLQEVFGAERTNLIFAPRTGNAVNSQSIVRAQKIELATKFNTHELALLVAVKKITSNHRQIIVQLHPIKSNILPQGLQMITFDTNNKAISRVEAKKDDNFIQTNIDGELEEEFMLQVLLTGASFVQDFVI